MIGVDLELLSFFHLQPFWPFKILFSMSCVRAGTLFTTRCYYNWIHVQQALITFHGFISAES